jgi:hypothetical protein
MASAPARMRLMGYPSAWDSQLGGGLWWRADKQTKNACVNGPAAIAVYQATGNTSYRTAGGLAVNWGCNNLTGQHIVGILNDEYDANGGSGDTAGFKSVFVRWASRYKSWLVTNANTAWSYRNSSGVMWGQWWRRTPDSPLTYPGRVSRKGVRRLVGGEVRERVL